MHGGKELHHRLIDAGKVQTFRRQEGVIGGIGLNPEAEDSSPRGGHLRRKEALRCFYR
jgi:hypothetical protein